jgi:AcrR family transcriptional regulator
VAGKPGANKGSKTKDTGAPLTTPTKRSAGRPTDRDSALTNKGIVQASIRQFAAKGFVRTSLREVGVEAGVTNGTVYHHYPTKESLYDAAYVSAIDELYARIAAAVGGHGDLLAKIDRTLDAVATVHADAPHLLNFVLRAWVEQAEDGVANFPIPRSVESFFEGLASAGIDSGALQESDANEFKYAVRALMWGLMALAMTGEEPMAMGVSGLKRLLSGGLIEFPRQRR